MVRSKNVLPTIFSDRCKLLCNHQFDTHVPTNRQHSLIRYLLCGSISWCRTMNQRTANMAFNFSVVKKRWCVAVQQSSAEYCQACSNLKSCQGADVLSHFDEANQAT